MSETTNGFTIEDYKRKIAGLLAKAEGTDNEAEQKAFSEKAERLMIKMGITAAELESRGEVKPEEIVEHRRVWTTIYAPVMGAFTFNVGRAYGHLNFLQSRWGKDKVVSYIIGHESDVEQFETLLNSLHLQVMSAVKAFRRENREERRYYSIHENFVTDRSFIEAYGYAVARRLREMRAEEEQAPEVSTGAALVLASKQDRVDAWQDAKYPKLGKARGGNSQWSSTGAAAGAAAGRNANLGGKAVGGRKAVGR